MASTLTLTTVHLPSAPVGPVNPLPAVAAMPQAPYEASVEGLPADIAENIRYGQVSSIHPYLLQDGYGRERTTAPMRVAVLENEHLRAEFALDLGGRLVALVNRATGRDLVYRNAMFQPANLGLRNAWFSGGAEWNVGMRGHWPLTCDPVYAATVMGDDGEPVLRMWEYERVRGLIVQIDAALDPDGPALHMRVRVRNPHEHETGMYWWTNIAIAMEPGSRVFAPATHAYRTEYDGTLGLIDLREEDISRPASAPAAADYFYDVPGAAAAAGREVEPWIAALDGDGHGLAHISTAPLTGRKLFVWGDTSGGRRWCEWLGGETGAYFEIQAGLATTQYEHLRMPGGATWEWTETFLPLHVDDPRREGEWTDGVDAVGGAVREAAENVGEAGRERLEALADAEPARILSTGSPWGALDEQLAARSGARFDGLPGTPFTAEGTEAEYWTALLAGEDVEANPAEAPASYVAGDGWERLLAAAPASWHAHYHRAVIAHADGAFDRAIGHYEASLHQARSAWAARGLGLALLAAGDKDAGLSHLADAFALAPSCIPLALELAEAQLDHGRAADAQAFVRTLPVPVQERGRFRMLLARAALAQGDRDETARILGERFEVPDLREGELSMSALWREARDEPVPAWYDFEMAPDAEAAPGR